MTQPTEKDSNAIGKAIYEFINLILDSVEESDGKVGLNTFFIETSLYHALCGTTYNKKCQLIDLKKGGKVIKNTRK